MVKSIYDLLNNSATPEVAPVVSDPSTANIASPQEPEPVPAMPAPQPAIPVPEQRQPSQGMVASIYDLLEKVPRYSEQQMQQPQQYEPTTALEFTPQEVPEVTPEKTSTEFREELSARDPFNSFAGSAYRMLGMEQQQEGQRQQIEQDTDINYLDRARRGEELAGRLKIDPEKVDYMGDMPVITPEMKRGLQQTDVEDLYTYLNQQRRGTRREKGKKLEEKGKQNIALGEQISPVAPRSRLLSQQIEEIGNLDPGLEASFKTGNVSGAVDALVFDAIISGNEEAISQAMSIKDEFSKVAGKKQKYMEEEGFFTKTINATVQMLPMLGKGAAVGSLPVIGPALSTSMWARQGAGELLTEMEEAGIPREISIPTALNAGLAYSLIESAQVGQVMNTGVKNAIKEPIMKKVKSILKAKGKDWFMENMEEIQQSLVQEYAFRHASEASDIPIDAAGKRKDYLQLITDTFKETAGPMGILSLLGVGGAGIKEFSQRDVEPPPTIEGLKETGIPKEPTPVQPTTEQKIPDIPEASELEKTGQEQQQTGKTLADFNLTVDDFMDLPADRADEIYFELSPEDQALIDESETKSIDVEELKKRVQGFERDHETQKEAENVNLQPSEKQIEAGNYKKGHIKRDGFDISLENPAGSDRKGVDQSGKEWKQEMNHDYGYIRGTKGADAYRDENSSDQVDVFINPGSEEGGTVFVVNQVDPESGNFDEHKIMVGFANENEAREAYLSNYEEGWKGLGSIYEMPMEEFKEWVYTDKTKLPYRPDIAAQPELEEVTVTEEQKSKADEMASSIEGLTVRGVNGGWKKGETTFGGQMHFNDSENDGTTITIPIDSTVDDLKKVVDEKRKLSQKKEIPDGVQGKTETEVKPADVPSEQIVSEPVVKQLIPDKKKDIYYSTEESRKKVQEIRAGNERSKNRGKEFPESETGELVETTIPISLFNQDQIDYVFESVDNKRVLRYRKDKIQTPIYAGKSNEGRWTVRDGGHRLIAAIDNGDKTIRALIPKEYINEIKKKEEVVPKSVSVPKEKGVPQKVEKKEDRYVSALEEAEKKVAEIENEWMGVSSNRVGKQKEAIKEIAKKHKVSSKKLINALLWLPTETEEVRYDRTEYEKFFRRAGKEPPVFGEYGQSFDIEQKEITESSKKVTEDKKTSKDMTGKPINIEDFGEKIGGARKDYYTRYSDELKDSGKYEVEAEPLSKTWPEPNYQKLLEDGKDPWTVAFIRAARDEIPTKPKSSWKLSGWVSQVNELRDLAHGLITGKYNRDTVKSKVEADVNLSDSVGNRAELYQALGHDKPLKGVYLKKRHYSIYRGEKNVFKWQVEHSSRRYGKKSIFSNMPHDLGTGNTKEEAIAEFKKKYDSFDKKEKPGKKQQLVIYRRGKKYFIAKKLRRGYLELKEFESGKEAFEYLKENRGSIEDMIQKYKEVPHERRLFNKERIGKDHRSGKDVTPEMFTDTFGFRGVEFGNWVNSKERQDNLNRSYDALVDLANILNIPTKAISLNGELGIGFGSRGHGGKRAPAAHYEPRRIVINLTRKNGPGSLAHEWWHAFDHYMARTGKVRKEMVTEAGMVRDGETIRPEMRGVFKELMDALQKTGIVKRSEELDVTRSKEYWSQKLEYSARSFENYVIETLKEMDASNDYLANVATSPEYASALADIILEGDVPKRDEIYPYLYESEYKTVLPVFKKLFETIKSKETDKGMALFAKRKDDIKQPPPSKGYQSDYEQRVTESIFSEAGKTAVPGSVRIKEGTVSQKRQKAIIEKVTGKKVVFVELNDTEMRKAFGHSADGFVLPGKKFQDTIFIDVNTQRPLLWTGFHEFSHFLEQNPEFKKQVIDAMKLTDKGKAEMYKSGKSEFVADIIGEMLSNHEFWENLEKQNETGFKKIASEFVRILSRIIREVQKYIDRFSNKVKSKLVYEEYLQEVEPVKKSVAKYISEYGKTGELPLKGIANAIREVDQTRTPEFKKWFGDIKSIEDLKEVDFEKKPLVTVGYRFGKAPNSGRSFNYRENKNEKGTSMASVAGSSESRGFATMEAKEEGRKKYYYKGEIIGYGGDGEIVLRNPIELTAKEYNTFVSSPKNDIVLLQLAVNKWRDAKFLKNRNYTGYDKQELKWKRIIEDYLNNGTFDVKNPDIRFARRETRKKELIEEKKPLKKELLKTQDKTLNTTYYQVDELQQKRRELKRKLGNIGNENIDQRIIIAEEISKMDALSREKVIAFISQYANRIGLSAEAKNRIDSIIMNSRGKGGLLRAVGIMDRLMERKQHSRYVKAAKKAISNAHVYLKGIAGKKRATTDIETNRALKKYLEELSGGDEETRKKVDAMISYYSEYGDSDLKKNRENYISELGEDVILWIEGEDSGVVPEAVKEIIPYLSYKPLQARSNKELIQIIRDIQSLKKEGRTQKSIEEDVRKEKLIKSANTISSSINKKTGLKPKTRADKSFIGGDKKGKKGLLKNAIDFANYDVTMTETILNSLSGDRGRNELTRAVFDPLYNADTKEKVGMRNFNKWYEKTHSDPSTGKELKMSKMRKPTIDITVESVVDGELKRVQKTITYADAMKIYAHSKNANQREHLIWTIMEPSTKVDPKDAQMENDAKREVAEGIIDKVISELPEQYKKMVKATWEYYDKSQHPRMNEVFVKEHGIDMPKEDYYFPIRGLQIDRASGLMERDILARSGAKASVGKGQTISRIGSRAALGNTDYFEDLLSNITSSEHYIAFNEAVRDVNRIISNPSIKESIRESSDAAWDSIFDWVKAMAYGRMDYGTKDDAADKAIKILRRNHAVFQLGFKALSIMIQPSSYIKGLSGVKKRYTIGSLLRFARNPYEFSTKINELSPQQEARIKNYEQGIQELMESKFKHMVDKKTKAAQKAYDSFVEIGMKGMGIVDKMVSDWLWDAKYRESLDSGMSVEDSIYEADKIVRKTQSGGGLLASSKFMRGSEFKRMFTQYQSDPMKSWNMLIEFINHFDKMSNAEKYNTIFYGFVLPAFYIYAVRSMRWPWEEPEEVAKEGIRSIVQGLVIAGVLFDAIATLGLDTVKSMRGVPVDKAWYNYISETDAPALGSISKIGEGILRKRSWSIFEGIGEMVGIVGGGQIKRTVEGGNLAIKHKNAKYLVLSRKSANSEFRQVNKAERAEPNDYVTEEYATRQNEWAQKKIGSWRKEKRDKYYEYQYTEEMMK